MKKLKVLGLAAIAAGMFSLTSCLDGGGNTQQLSSYAIVDYSSTMGTLIYPLGYYPLYVATIANDPTYRAGDCVLANFTVDFDSADNANASTNGFYVATGAASSPLAKYDLSYSPLDSMALDNELLLSGSESALLFSNNYKRIVVIPTFTSVLTDQKNTYIMSMDSIKNLKLLMERTVFIRCAYVLKSGKKGKHQPLAMLWTRSLLKEVHYILC